MSAIGEKRHGAGGASVCGGTTELRIRQDEILRELVLPEHGAIDAGRYRRQAFVPRTWKGAVIQLGQLSRQCRVVSVGEIAPQRGAVSQMQCAGLRNAINRRASDWSKPGAAGDVNTFEHLIQQRRIPSRPRRIEGLFQTIG